MTTTDALVVLVTAPSADEAARIGRVLVDERLAACVNVLGGVRSIYRWQGAVHDEAETLMLVKTTRSRFEAVRERILALHSYDTPEVLALSVDAGSERYLAWLTAEST